MSLSSEAQDQSLSQQLRGTFLKEVNGLLGHKALSHALFPWCHLVTHSFVGKAVGVDLAGKAVGVDLAGKAVGVDLLAQGKLSLAAFNAVELAVTISSILDNPFPSMSSTA